MSKIAIGAGLVATASAYGMQIGAYFDGLAFDQSWLYPMIGVPILLVSVLTYIMFSLTALMEAIKKSRKATSLVPLLVLPVLFFSSYYLPIPRFIDGLHDAVESKLDRSRLLEMAEAARELKRDMPEEQRFMGIEKELAAAFPEELSIGGMLARAQISKKSVNIYYGSALTKHWGYAVVQSDECPLDHIPSNLCRKVYDNVWVYKDIW